jgi:hypothetical protein
MNNFNTQFITAEYLYKYTPIDDNVDADLLRKFILQAQNLNIQECIGQNLFRKLINDCPNFTGPYLNLMKEYIQPAAAQWAFYYSMDFINFRFTNKAISLKNSDNSNPSTIEDIKWLKQGVRDTAEFYTENIKRYIKANQGDFPEYFQIFSWELKPNRTNYFSGIKTSGYKWRGRDIRPDNVDPCDFCD